MDGIYSLEIVKAWKSKLMSIGLLGAADIKEGKNFRK